MPTIQGYCTKCQQIRDMVNPQPTTVKGQPATKGTCPVDGTTIYKNEGQRIIVGS